MECLPNYHNGSLVNLMSSIRQAFGSPSAYAPLPGLNPAQLATAHNVILLVIDGLGYDYLVNKAPNSFLREHLSQQLTSMFPSTTAACVTTFATGVAPQQHAVTGWFMYLKELGTVTSILPFRPRYARASFQQANINPKRFLDQPSIFSKMAVTSYVVMPKTIAQSAYNLVAMAGAHTIAYEGLELCLEATYRAAMRQGQKYVYAYWPGFDSLSHCYGNNSQGVLNHFHELDHGIRRLAQRLKGTQTTLLVTADHGFIDATPDAIIRLDKHPRLQETLVLPLCGEARTVYCYVRPARVAQFEDYVNTHLDYACTMYPAHDIIGQGCFGLFTPHHKLIDRVGDYILVMKENYTLRDQITGEPMLRHIGFHGGVSHAEMFVPLIQVDT